MLEDIKNLDLDPDLRVVPLPCMARGQARFDVVSIDGKNRVQLMKRSIMDTLMATIDSHAARQSVSKHVYVHGPKGKSIRILTNLKAL